MLLHSGAFYVDDCSDVFFSVEHPTDRGPSVLVIKSTLPDDFKDTESLFRRINTTMEASNMTLCNEGENPIPPLRQPSDSESDTAPTNNISKTNAELSNWHARKQAFKDNLKNLLDDFESPVVVKCRIPLKLRVKDEETWYENLTLKNGMCLLFIDFEAEEASHFFTNSKKKRKKKLVL